MSKSSPPRNVSPFVHLEDASPSPGPKVDGAAAEIVDDDLGFFLQVDGIGQRSRRRLVDDALDVEPGDAAGVLGGLALGIVEIGGDGDDHAVDGVAQVAVGRVLELDQDHGRDLFRRIDLVVDLDAQQIVAVLDDMERELLQVGLDLGVFLPHQGLDRRYGVERVGDHLALGRLSDQLLMVLL